MRDIKTIKTQAEVLEILDILENDRWKNIILSRYKEKYTCRMLSQKYGFSQQRASALVLIILERFREIEEQRQEEKRQEEIKLKETEKEEQPLERSVATLNITKSAQNCLRRAGIDTVGEAIKLFEEFGDFKGIRNVGEGFNQEIVQALGKFMEEEVYRESR